MSAINVVDAVCELIVGDCFLIIFEHSPSRMGTENADLVRRANASGEDREKDEKK